MCSKRGSSPETQMLHKIPPVPPSTAHLHHLVCIAMVCCDDVAPIHLVNHLQQLLQTASAQYAQRSKAVLCYMGSCEHTHDKMVLTQG